MQLLDERKENGIQDHEGKTNRALPKNYQALVEGTKNQIYLIGVPVKGALFEFSPTIHEYLKAHLFGDIFSRDILTWKERELITISILSG